MKDDTLNPNIEWKNKKNIGKKERLSRRKESLEDDLKQENRKDEITRPLSLRAEKKNVVGKSLNKMRKRIREALDDDDDDEDFVSATPFIFDYDNLFKNDISAQVSSESENKAAEQKQNLHHMKMQKSIAQLKAMAAADMLARKAGLNHLSPEVSAEIQQSNTSGKEAFRLALQHGIAPDVDIHPSELTERKIKALMTGLRRLKKIGKLENAQGLKVQEVIKITDNKLDDKKVAKLLLEKTGRHNAKPQKKKTPPSKVSFKKLIRQRQEEHLMRV